MPPLFNTYFISLYIKKNRSLCVLRMHRMHVKLQLYYTPVFYFKLFSICIPRVSVKICECYQFYSHFRFFTGAFVLLLMHTHNTTPKCVFIMYISEWKKRVYVSRHHSRAMSKYMYIKIFSAIPGQLLWFERTMASYNGKFNIYIYK